MNRNPHLRPGPDARGGVLPAGARPPAGSKPPSRPRQRGSVYVFVLGTAMMVSVIGLSALTLARVNTKVNAQTDDAAHAATLAEAAVEHALSALAADRDWRTTYRHDEPSPGKALGEGTISFVFADDDLSLDDDPNDPVRVYGTGRVRDAVKVYSVQLVGKGAPLEVLKTVAHSAADVTTAATIYGAGGPFSAAGNFEVPWQSVVDGDVEALTIDERGDIYGARRPGSPPKAMPSPGVFNTYKAMATEIPYDDIPSAVMTLQVLSPANNPYGPTNPKGIYHVHVSGSWPGNLTIRQMRIVGTLLVTLDPGVDLTVSTNNAWGPAQADYPALIVNAGPDSKVTLNGSNTGLSEAVTLYNFNPPHTPHPWPSGASNDTTADTYPTELRGVVHVIGAGAATSLGSNLVTKGTVIAEGALALGSNIKLATDPQLLTATPAGYSSTSTMSPVPGTWRWEKVR